MEFLTILGYGLCGLAVIIVIGLIISFLRALNGSVAGYDKGGGKGMWGSQGDKPFKNK